MLGQIENSHFKQRMLEPGIGQAVRIVTFDGMAADSSPLTIGRIPHLRENVSLDISNKKINSYTTHSTTYSESYSG